MKKFIKNKMVMSLTVLAVLVSGFALFGFWSTNSQASTPRDDCNVKGTNYNAIIKCGATTPAELAKKFKENAKGDLPKIYKHYGLSASDINNAGSKAQMGRVYKDGRVTIGNKVVATNAYSIGRHNIPGSKKLSIGNYYERKTSVSFNSNFISAFVFLDANGDFRAAILTSCGNPVRATKPVYKCENLTQAIVPGSRNKFNLTAKASAKDGAKIVNYTFDMGDGTKKTVTSNKYTHTYAKAGTYTATVKVKVKINNSYDKEATSANCKVTIKVVEPSYECTGLTAEKISRNEYKFTATATAKDGAKVTGYKYDFGDGTVKENASATETHTYEKPGEYNVKVWAVVTIDGKQIVEKTSSKCEVKVPVAKEPVYTCDYLKKNTISRTEYTFTGKATAENGPTITNYTIDFGDGTTAEITDPTDVPHEYAEPGDYTAKMTANMVVDGAATPVTSEACEVEVTVVPPNKVEVCDPTTGETIVVDEGDEGNYPPVGDPACEPVEVCDPETGKTIIVDKKDEGNYPPVGDAACEPKEEEPCVPAKGNECEEIPEELPTTGPMDMIGGMLGLGSLVAAGYYWYASRRGLLVELLKR